MKIYCSCCDKVQSVRIDNCRDAKTNEPFQDIVCATCDLVIASGTDIAQPDPYKQGYADAMNWKVQNHLEHLPTAQPEQEPVAWGVDWGKAGDIPCVSIIKRVPNGGIEVMAVEYAPYSYTTPPQQEPVRIMGFNCKCGRRMEVSAEQGVVPAPQRKPLTDEKIDELWESTAPYYNTHDFARAIEAKLKEKNA